MHINCFTKNITENERDKQWANKHHHCRHFNKRRHTGQRRFQNGHIVGNVVCQNANVIGIIDGNLSVKEFLTLYASSRVKGDIVANKLAIEPGAYFTGSCHMLDELSD